MRSDPRGPHWRRRCGDSDIAVSAAVFAGIIRSAIDNLNSRSTRVRNGAVAWFLSRKEEFGCFVWYCKVMGLDPGVVLREMERRGLIRRAILRGQGHGEEE
jgi:hypothetical protein